jgi:hypothetical protein
MPDDAPPSADAAGFSDRAFEARYDQATVDVTGGEPPRAAPTANSASSAATPRRSRNSYMRSRARRQAASQPG